MAVLRQILCYVSRYGMIWLYQSRRGYAKQTSSIGDENFIAETFVCLFLVRFLLLREVLKTTSKNLLSYKIQQSPAFKKLILQNQPDLFLI